LLDPRHRRVDSVAEKEGKGEEESDPRRKTSKKRRRKVKKRHKGSEKEEQSLESEGEENNSSDSDTVETVVAAMKDPERSWRTRESNLHACSDRNLVQKVEVRASTEILLRKFLHDVHSTCSIPTRSLLMDSASLPRLIKLRYFSRMSNLLNWVE